MLQMYIDSVERAQPRNFRVYPKATVHSVVTKYVHFAVGIYKLADLCESGQDMIMHRLTQLKGHVSELVEQMGTDHFGENS
jgi:hypothetical protein